MFFLLTKNFSKLWILLISSQTKFSGISPILIIIFFLQALKNTIDIFSFIIYLFLLYSILCADLVNLQYKDHRKNRLIFCPQSFSITIHTSYNFILEFDNPLFQFPSAIICPNIFKTTTKNKNSFLTWFLIPYRKECVLFKKYCMNAQKSFENQPSSRIFIFFQKNIDVKFPYRCR